MALLIAYEGQDATPELGAVGTGGQVVSLERALRLLASRKSGLDALWPWIGAALADSRILLGSLASLEPVVEEAVDAFGDRAVVADSVDGVTPLPFVSSPSKVFGLGYNYHALCEREGVRPGEKPHVFMKVPTSVTGPRDVIRTPVSVTKLDFEAELAVIIGQVTCDVTADVAATRIGGYTVVNDLCAKILPRPTTEAETTTVMLKGPDQFAPLGAVVLTGADAADIAKRELVCRVNGEERQRFQVDDWVHDAATTVAYLSSIMTLLPGDLIAMGTSLGIGIVEVPPRLLNDGDLVECEIAGFTGTRNMIRFSG